MASAVSAEFRLTPSVLVREEYNDNINLDPDDEEDDFITTVEPSVSILWSTRLVDLTFDYGLRLRDYLKNSENDEFDLDQAQRANLSTQFALYQDLLFLRVSDVFERVPIDEGERGAIDNELINLTNKNQLILNPYIQLQPWSTTTFSLGYSYVNIWYQEDEAVDSQTHTVYATVDRELTSRINVAVTGSYIDYQPEDLEVEDGVVQADPGYESTEVRTTVRWTVNDYIFIDGFYARQWIDYNRDEQEIFNENLPQVEIKNQQTLDLFGASGTAQVSPEVTLSGGVNRTRQHTVQDGLRENTEYFASLNYESRLTGNLYGFYRESEYLTLLRDDEAWGLTMNSNWRLTNKLSLGGLLSYLNYSENLGFGENEEYDRYGLRLALIRDLRLGALRFGYTWNKNDSSVSSNDFINNILWGEIRFTF